MQEFNIITISVNEPCYKNIFSNIEPSVKKLYAIGNVKLLDSSRGRVSIVGTRCPTPYGVDVTKSLTQKLVEADVTIVSGLAYGIDSIAHKTTVDHGGKTIAVLPSSLTNVYPAAHTNLAKQILRSGGLLISERHPEEKPMKHYFIERNRLIAALSGLVIVPEATHKTGVRHTVNFAVKLGKPIAVVPGNITSPQSQFTNTCLNEGAQPIISTDYILELLQFNNIPIANQKVKHIISNGNKADPENLILYSISQRQLSSNELVQSTGLSISEVNTYISLLEIKGMIKNNENNKWRLAK